MQTLITLTKGTGEARASFGELAQGQLQQEQNFLITLPINLKSKAEVTIKESKKQSIHCEYPKSEAITKAFIKKYIPNKNVDVKIILTRNVPIGKGLSSSSADQVAVIRALANALHITLTEKDYSELLTQIEPHDGLHYNHSVQYDHRKGELIQQFNHTPKYKILCLDFGGLIDTCEYNKKLHFTKKDIDYYENIVQEFTKAFKQQDDNKIAMLALNAGKFHAKNKNDEQLTNLLEETEDYGALGAVITHSGTCCGLLYPKETPNKFIQEQAKKISKKHKATTSILETNNQ